MPYKTLTPTQVRILELLFENPILSGEKIAKTLNISRTAVWKNIQILIRSGYPITSEKKGYKLMSKDVLLPNKLESLLKILDPKFKVYHFWETSSTMDVAKDLAEREDLALVIAERQTFGRGRLSRPWISNEGGIWMSLLIKLPLSLKESFVLSYMVSLSVVEVLRKLVSPRFFLKWPNDVVYQENEEEFKKVAGVLIEVEAEMDKLKYAIIGIGINVNNRIANLEPTGTSLLEITAQKWDRHLIISECLALFLKYLKTDPYETLNKWKAYSVTLGRIVKVIQPGREILGKALDISEDGALILEINHTQIKIYSGDCINLRTSS